VRREQILDAAERVFANRDPGEVTFEEVAAGAGVSRGLVYNYFGDKGGLIAAVYLRGFTRLDDQLRGIFARSGPPSERLRAVVRCYLTFARENGPVLAFIGTAEGSPHPAIRKARRQRYERLVEHWGDNPETRTLARGVTALLEASASEWIATGADDDEGVELIHQLLWSGIPSLGYPMGGDTVPPTAALAVP
jgi:AcrR family transcriptional regulator